ncbi:MAG: SUMF1/EgtB/PvdO family nonheme iron enzyme, partial [Candidatus Latescibacteria bacterium]|nr:SUMF1/EgtB/PvdO family nonheme iron enzyme [Candidatus Latescibacterota bacterium]
DTEADLDRTGWYLGNSGGSSHPVGLKEPNAWGLCDMHGNVWEMCCDASDEYDGRYGPEPVTDPVSEGNFNYRVNRGGSWFSEPSECRSAVRGKFWTGGGSNHLGFRVAQSIR